MADLEYLKEVLEQMAALDFGDTLHMRTQAHFKHYLTTQTNLTHYQADKLVLDIDINVEGVESSDLYWECVDLYCIIIKNIIEAFQHHGICNDAIVDSDLELEFKL